MAITNIMQNPNFRWGTWNAPYSLDDTVNTTEPVDTTSGLAPILYPQVTGEGNQNDGIRQLTNTIPQKRMLTQDEQALFSGTDRQLIDNSDRQLINTVGPMRVNVPEARTIPSEENLMIGDTLGYGMIPASFSRQEDSTPFYDPMQLGPGVYAEPIVTADEGYVDDDDEEEYLTDRIMDKNLMSLYPQQYKQRKESGTGIRSVISTAFQGAKDFVSNLGKRRQELRDQGYSEDEINFIGANAMGKQFVDAGKYDPMGGYYDTPSGVKDKYGYNVYARNYMEPGSASYKKWSGITKSLAYKDRIAKEKTEKQKRDIQLAITTEEKKKAAKKIITPTTYQTVHDTGAVTQTPGRGQTSISRGTTASQAAGMGGGSRQATSAGATSSGRTDSGWGWAKGGIVGIL